MAKLKELEKNIFYKKELVETGSQLDLVKWRFDELGMDLSDLTRIVYDHQHTYYSFLLSTGIIPDNFNFFNYNRKRTV